VLRDLRDAVNFESGLATRVHGICVFPGSPAGCFIARFEIASTNRLPKAVFDKRGRRSRTPSPKCYILPKVKMMPAPARMLF
jgi:hypothetical protein